MHMNEGVHMTEIWWTQLDFFPIPFIQWMYTAYSDFFCSIKYAHGQANRHKNEEVKLDVVFCNGGKRLNVFLDIQI